MKKEPLLILQDDFTDLDYDERHENNTAVTEDLFDDTILTPCNKKEFLYFAKKCIDFARSVGGSIKLFTEFSLPFLVIKATRFEFDKRYTDFILELTKIADHVEFKAMAEEEIFMSVYFFRKLKQADTAKVNDLFNELLILQQSDIPIPKKQTKR